MGNGHMGNGHMGNGHMRTHATRGIGAHPPARRLDSIAAMKPSSTETAICMVCQDDQSFDCMGPESTPV